MSIEEMKENLITQMNELEALKSVFPTELVVSNHGILADINSFIDKESCHNELPPRLDYTLNMMINQENIEFNVNLPLDYPNVKPEIHVRILSSDRMQQSLLNDALKIFLNSHEIGEPCIYNLISWIQDNIENYLDKTVNSMEKLNLNSSSSKNKGAQGPVFVRYWIYSHHIYNKLKRRSIVNFAKDHSLTGFCLVGKPGILCIEGDLEDCDDWWKKIKSMNWQKIFIKLIEKNVDTTDVNTDRKFNDFQEISFPSCDRHNDMKAFLEYLTEHSSQHVFKQIFDIE